MAQRIQVENMSLLLFHTFWLNFLLILSETFFYAHQQVNSKIYQYSSKLMFNLKRV